MSRAVIGHNNGPTMEAGTSWRRHCWGKARRDLLPSLPIEVVRGRVRRAAEIGLNYRTYATVRATTGTDIVAFLFSSNALRLFRADQTMEAARADKLRDLVKVARLGAAQPPLRGRDLSAMGDLIDLAADAPRFTDSAAITRDKLRALLAQGGVTPKSVLVVGETSDERTWSLHGRMAGHLTGAQYFTDQ
ncbi:hypothetical protein ACMU_11395 [Actibacterium mucosum KCTC 23349]|uniref:Uncharacterized protein n=1 Tax=Actibacterium mucosum KCTC 23349 TaxID=1454373 RepID=A0A037ZFN4_9RHOB|nr:hypothetical protein [Actibacterium mucosum]KAJ55295.1 hypothetical protein ACMU_11395 [Actibacterium mucosum KCTC 23349]